MKMLVWIIVMAVGWPLTVLAADNLAAPGAIGVSTPHVLEAKHSKSVFYAADDEMARAETGVSGAVQQTLGYRLIPVAPSELKQKLAEKGSDNLQVFYTSPQRSARNRYIATGNLVVQLAPGVDPQAFAAENHLTLLRPVYAEGGIYLMATISPAAIIEESNTLNALPQVKHVSPDWIRPVLLR